MNDDPAPGISVNLTGDVTGQVAVGQDIRQSQVTAVTPLTPAEREEVARLFAGLRDQVWHETPPEQWDTADGKLQELEEAVAGDEPDMTTIAYVKRWFARNLPKAAGLVAAIFVNPLVGRLVQAAGEAAASELDGRAES